MTSTVLDVTVLLLCLSASVVALGNTGGGPKAEPAGGTAGDIADRLVTETATVTYSTDGSERDDGDGGNPIHGTRTVHATLVELLVMTATNGGETGTGLAGRFRSKAMRTVDDALDPRTRVDVRAGRAERPESEGSGVSASAGGLRPVPGVGNGVRSTATWIGEGTNGSRSAPGRQAVSIGDEPPRNADVTTAIVTHPGSNGSRGTDVRIVIRAW